MEQFRDNSTANEGKNNYAWRKLDGGSKLSSLRISLKMRDFRAKKGKDCGDCKEIKDLQKKMVEKEEELEHAYRENKSDAEIKKLEQELDDLTTQFSQLTGIEKKKEPVAETETNNTTKWIIGISVVSFVLLVMVVVIANKKKKCR